MHSTEANEHGRLALDTHSLLRYGMMLTVHITGSLPICRGRNAIPIGNNKRLLQHCNSVRIHQSIRACCVCQPDLLYQHLNDSPHKSSPYYCYVLAPAWENIHGTFKHSPKRRKGKTEKKTKCVETHFQRAPRFRSRHC